MLGAWQGRGFNFWGCGSRTWPDGPWSYQKKVGAYVYWSCGSVHRFTEMNRPNLNSCRCSPVWNSMA